MRLITRKLWRAFPELDRFDDEKCRRFVDTAKRGLWPAVGRFFINLACCVAVFIVITGVGGLIVELMTPDPAPSAAPPRGPARSTSRLTSALYVYGWFTAVVLGLVSAFVMSLIMRDQLLRRRVALFIKARGRCPRCRYVLLGVRVPDNLKINCPECGLELEVDEALTELAGAPPPARVGAAGGPTEQAAVRERRLARAPEERGWLPAWVTPRMRWWLLRAVIALAALAVLGPVSWWGFSLWRVHAQAGRAAASRVGLTGLDKIIESLNPPDIGEKDAWDWFDAVHALKFQAERDVLDTVPEDVEAGINSAGSLDKPFPDYAMLLSAYRDREGFLDEGLNRVNADLARRSLARKKELGIVDLLEKMASAKRAAIKMPPLVPGQQPDIFVVRYSEVRELCRMLTAKMIDAARAGDEAGFTLALRSELAAVRMLERHPTLISQLVAVACEALVLESLRLELLREEQWPEARLKAVEDAFREFATGSVPISAALNGEREYALDSVRWFFADASQVLHGGLQNLIVSDSDRVQRLPVGTLEQNIAAIDAYFDALIEYVAKPRAAKVAAAWPPPPKYQFAAAITPSASRGIDYVVSTACYRHGVRIMVAIERHRARRGHAPPTLDDLVPEYLQALPSDPYARDGRFRYQPLAGGAYTLYSVGFNGVDDGGTGPDIGKSADTEETRKRAEDLMLRRAE